MDREALMSALIKQIGAEIETIGEAMQEDCFAGLAVKLVRVKALADAAYTVEELRKL